MPEDTPLPRPLEDVTVLDLTTALAGPFATMLLAGLGARVIKIENPLNGDSSRENAPYLGAQGATLVRRYRRYLRLRIESLAQQAGHHFESEVSRGAAAASLIW